MASFLERAQIEVIRYLIHFRGLNNGKSLTSWTSGLFTNLLQTHFPVLATLLAEADAFWQAKRNLICKRDGLPFRQTRSSAARDVEDILSDLRMEFGLFFTMAINVSVGGRVHSILHRDFKNLAVGLCGIFPFGKMSCC